MPCGAPESLTADREVLLSGTSWSFGAGVRIGPRRSPPSPLWVL